MVLRWIEGFEVSGDSSYLEKKYATALSAASATPGRMHGRYGRGTLTTPSLGSQNSWVIGVGMYVPTTPVATENYVALFRGGIEQLRVRVNASRQIEVVRGSTVIETGATVLPANTWFYLEVKATVRTSTNGSYSVRINEVEEVADTGVNTANSGSDGADVFKFVAGASTRIDDIYILDSTGSVNNDLLGDQTVEGLLPTGDGASTDWTPSTGSTHYVLVDDPATALDTADYVASSTIGHEDYYELANLSFIQGDINGVAVAVTAALDAVGARTMRARFRNSSGTEYGSATAFTVAGTIASEQLTIFDVNPVSTSAWAVADIDGAQWGVEVVS